MTLEQIHKADSSPLASQEEEKKYEKMLSTAPSSNARLGDQANLAPGSSLQIQAAPVLEQIDSTNLANRQKMQNFGALGAASGGSDSLRGERPPQSNMLTDFAKPLQDLLEKLHLSIQCNSALYQDEEGNFSSPDGGSTSKHGS